MVNYDTMNADEILKTIIADGVVDANEVLALDKKLERDWIVSREEIKLLFRVNQSLGTGDKKCPEWTAFFAQNVARLLIMDLDTPGEIDEAEGNWLADLFDQHGVGNATELALLNALQKDASKIHGRIALRLSPQ